MLTEKPGIGPGLLFCLVFAVVLGYGLPRIAFLGAKYIGPNGYWGLILAFILSLPVILAIVSLGRNFPEHSLLELLPLLFGRPAGVVLGLLYVLFFLALMIWEIRAAVEIFHIYFLVRTPVGVTIVALILSAAYIASKGIEGITRLAAFLFILPLLFILLSLVASYQGFDPDNVRPVFFFEGGKIFSGTVHLFDPFLPLASLFLIYRYFTEKQKLKGFKVIVAAAGLAGILLLAMMVGTIGVFGAKKVAMLSWPFMELTKHSDLPYLLQTTGLFFACVYLIEAVISLGAIYFTAADAAARLIKHLTYKWFLAILFPIITWAALNVKSELESLQFFDGLRIAGFVAVFVLPLVIWIGTAVFHRRLI